MSSDRSRHVSMSSADVVMRVHDGPNGTPRHGSRGDRRSKRSNDLQMRSTVSIIDENRESKPRKDSRYGSDVNLATTHRAESSGRDGSTRKDNRYESNNSLSGISRTIHQPIHISADGLVNAGFIGSVGGSAGSLTVVREQYCSCTRWSKLEKMLVISVTILGVMVLALVVTVGILAEGKSDKINNWWMF